MIPAPTLREVRIAGRSVGPGHPTYVVAEMSANHGGILDRALRIIEAAKNAGADAVKLQTFTADTLTLDSAEGSFRVKGTVWDGRTLHDLYEEATTPWEWHPRLKEAAESVGLALFSAPFDLTAVDHLERMHVPAYKVASAENVDIPLLRAIGKTGKPVVMSTGMATLAEIDEAVRTLRTAGCEELVLLKCTSVYPAPINELNLRSIGNLGQTFGAPVGFSDHTLGWTTTVAAVAQGACLIEKHLTLSRSDPGPDSTFSTEPHEFAAMVTAIRDVEAALGTVTYGPTTEERKSLLFRRSLFVVRDMRAGDVFTAENVRSIRPATGLHTRHLDEVIGRRAARDIARGTPLSWELVGHR